MVTYLADISKVPPINLDSEITITSMAEHLNLSASTVSKALRGVKGVNRDTETRVKKLADQLGYRPNMFARGLKNKKSHLIGFLLTAELTSPWYAELISCVEAKLRIAGYTMMLGIGNRNEVSEMDCFEMFAGSFLAGIIAGPLYTYRDYALFRDRVDTRRTPLIAFACTEDVPVSHVKINHISAAYQSVEYLVKQGHRRIGYFCCSSRAVRAGGLTRQAGFEMAMQEFGLPIAARDLVIGDMKTYETGYKVMDKLLKERKGDLPTAFFCHNDEVALGAMEALRLNGVRVPEDISLIGHDDIKRASLSVPGLTTVGGIMEELTEKLSDMLFASLEGQTGEIETASIEPHLVIRESVKRCC